MLPPIPTYHTFYVRACVCERVLYVRDIFAPLLLLLTALCVRTYVRMYGCGDQASERGFFVQSSFVKKFLYWHVKMMSDIGILIGT